MSKVSKVLVVLASPEYQQDQRANLVIDLTKTYIEGCQKKGLDVDVIELFQDLEFNPVLKPEEADSKTLEYQIRFDKADLISFFYPLWWGGVPAILKGFLDKVLVPGFAYKIVKERKIPLLKKKSLEIFAFSTDPVWKIRFVYRDADKNMWSRVIAQELGFKSRYSLVGSIRSQNQNQITRIKKRVTKMANKINSETSILDLL